MGLVPSELDDVYAQQEAASAPSGGGGGLLPAGDYTGSVVESSVRPGMKPWVTAELSLKLQVTEGEHAGKSTFCDIELAPNTNKENQPSPGKLKFVKGQLENGLGFSGRLSEVEDVAHTFVGAVVEFRQKVDDHLDENGNPDQYAKINPSTNQPYIDREVYLNKLVTPGFAAAPVAAEASTTPTVY